MDINESLLRSLFKNVNLPNQTATKEIHKSINPNMDEKKIRSHASVFICFKLSSHEFLYTGIRYASAININAPAKDTVSTAPDATFLIVVHLIFIRFPIFKISATSRPDYRKCSDIPLELISGF